MNLHISSPSVFIETFHKNLIELGLENNNRIILRSAKEHSALSSAPLYSRKFDGLTGDTFQYKKVFIHQFSPLMYRWVATNKFNEVNWMVWGADLYNLQGLSQQMYEPITRRYNERHWSIQEFLYHCKVVATSLPFKKAALQKVNHVLTWMHEEFLFAKSHLPIDNATRKFFFYENQNSYGKINAQAKSLNRTHKEDRVFILGNSGTPANNHLDAFGYLAENNFDAKLIIPVSYGDAPYINYLRQAAPRVYQGPIEFIDSYMNFYEYINLLASMDGLIMNTIRPQGYGNIFMMLAMNKPVYMNSKNISWPDLIKNNIHCNSIEDLFKGNKSINNEQLEAVNELFLRDRLVTIYQELFS